MNYCEFCKCYHSSISCFAPGRSELEDLFSRLQAVRIVNQSNNANRAVIEYKISMTVEEYEHIRSMIGK